MMTDEHVETVIIGGGQAGLSVGYHLRSQEREVVILDGSERGLYCRRMRLVPRMLLLAGQPLRERVARFLGR